MSSSRSTPVADEGEYARSPKNEILPDWLKNIFNPTLEDYGFDLHVQIAELETIVGEIENYTTVASMITERRLKPLSELQVASRTGLCIGIDKGTVNYIYDIDGRRVIISDELASLCQRLNETQYYILENLAQFIEALDANKEGRTENNQDLDGPGSFSEQILHEIGTITKERVETWDSEKLRGIILNLTPYLRKQAFTYRLRVRYPDFFELLLVLLHPDGIRDITVTVESNNSRQLAMTQNAITGRMVETLFRIEPFLETDTRASLEMSLRPYIDFIRSVSGLDSQNIGTTMRKRLFEGPNPYGSELFRFTAGFLEYLILRIYAQHLMERVNLPRDKVESLRNKRRIEKLIEEGYSKVYEDLFITLDSLLPSSALGRQFESIKDSLELEEATASWVNLNSKLFLKNLRKLIQERLYYSTSGEVVTKRMMYGLITLSRVLLHNPIRNINGVFARRGIPTFRGSDEFNFSQEVPEEMEEIELTEIDEMEVDADQFTSGTSTTLFPELTKAQSNRFVLPDMLIVRCIDGNLKHFPDKPLEWYLSRSTLQCLTLVEVKTVVRPGTEMLSSPVPAKAWVDQINTYLTALWELKEDPQYEGLIKPEVLLVVATPFRTRVITFDVSDEGWRISKDKGKYRTVSLR